MVGHQFFFKNSYFPSPPPPSSYFMTGPLELSSEYHEFLFGSRTSTLAYVMVFNSSGRY